MKQLSEARQAHSAAEAALKENPRSHGRWVAWQQSGADYYVAKQPEAAKYRRGNPDRVLEPEEIEALAERLQHARDGVPDTWRLIQDESKRTEYSAQVAWFHELYVALYAPVEAAYESVQHRKASGVEALLRFLEVDPFCHRSGYWKADILNAITRIDLDEQARDRLEAILFAVIEKPARREFRRYVRLARYLDSDRLREALMKRVASGGVPGARHAQWVLGGLGQGRTT